MPMRDSARTRAWPRRRAGRGAGGPGGHAGRGRTSRGGGGVQAGAAGASASRVQVRAVTRMPTRVVATESALPRARQSDPSTPNRTAATAARPTPRLRPPGGTRVDLGSGGSHRSPPADDDSDQPQKPGLLTGEQADENRHGGAGSRDGATIAHRSHRQSGVTGRLIPRADVHAVGERHPQEPWPVHPSPGTPSSPSASTTEIARIRQSTCRVRRAPLSVPPTKRTPPTQATRQQGEAVRSCAHQVPSACEAPTMSPSSGGVRGASRSTRAGQAAGAHPAARTPGEPGGLAPWRDLRPDARPPLARARPPGRQARQPVPVGAVGREPRAPGPVRGQPASSSSRRS